MDENLQGQLRGTWSRDSNSRLPFWRKRDAKPLYHYIGNVASMGTEW